MYRKLKRVWSHNSFTYIPKFRETFPELNKIDYEEMCRRFQDLGIDFYTEEKVEVKKWIRLTLPFAVILMILMFVGLPFAFILTGKWSYGIASKSRIYNWFRSLRLLS
jgi:hypothetical protein